MTPTLILIVVSVSHPAWGEWIEIAQRWRSLAVYWGLTPHGVSGLKCGMARYLCHLDKSHPAWGEWIEIFLTSPVQSIFDVSPRMG